MDIHIYFTTHINILYAIYAIHLYVVMYQHPFQVNLVQPTALATMKQSLHVLSSFHTYIIITLNIATWTINTAVDHIHGSRIAMQGGRRLCDLFGWRRRHFRARPEISMWKY